MKTKLLKTISTLIEVCTELTSKNKWLKTELSITIECSEKKTKRINELIEELADANTKVKDFKEITKKQDIKLENVLDLAQEQPNTKLGKSIINLISPF